MFLKINSPTFSGLIVRGRKRLAERASAETEAERDRDTETERQKQRNREEARDKRAEKTSKSQHYVILLQNPNGEKVFRIECEDCSPP